ncbi:MAG: type I 3-dehydroquinate dehydratase, partial [Planctomycetes bacterium]|nr:type I 3-dehydroquinate dehydratase [Planctomycetota bacterium]
MIAVSIVPQSQRLAMMDMEAAVSRGAGLVELRLDRLRQVPELRSLLASKKCPVIVSCRRPQDGGHWQGDEAARLKLLRQAAEAGADYVEIELDCAPQAPRSGKAKRIISFTTLSEPVQDLDKVRTETLKHAADVIRIAVPTPALEQAW